MEDAIGHPDTLDHTKCLTTKLEVLGEEYKSHYYAIIDLIDEEEALKAEQEVFDADDETMVQLSMHIQRMTKICSKPPESYTHKIASKQLSRLMTRLLPVQESIVSVIKR